MRHTDHGAFQNPLDSVDHALDLFRVDIQPARDDQILVTPDNADIAVSITHGHVAGDEEAVITEGFGGLLRHFPIAEKDIVAALLDDADLAIRQWRAGLRVGNADVHTGKRKADGAGAAVAIERIRGAHIGFGHAIAFKNGFAGARLELAVRFRQKRRRAGDEQPHMRAGLAGEAVMVKKPRVEGRNPHHCGRLRHPFQRHVSRIFRQEDHRPADQRQQVAGHEQAVGMIDRQHVKKHVIGCEAPVVAKHLGIRAQVAVAQLRPL